MSLRTLAGKLKKLEKHILPPERKTWAIVVVNVDGSTAEVPKMLVHWPPIKALERN